MGNTILVIGAGAAGLVAARALAKAGKKVIVLEARNYIGGRIHTLYGSSFFDKAELGAEFIHGDLPVTLNLLKQAGIASQTISLQMWRYRDGKFKHEEEQVEGWDEVMQKLADLKTDMPIATFMQQNFGDKKYSEVTKSVLQFVAGYDTADPAKASAFALRKEWQSEDDDAQHRIPGGYCSLISYLANDCKKHGGIIELNAIVKDIYWENRQVRAVTADGTEYTAGQAIIALPLGVLQLQENRQGAIHFHPPIPKQTEAIGKIGFGAIIKILLQFDAPFWEDEQYGGIKDPAFLFTEEKIPTWWTQNAGSPLLTGWLGGGAAIELKGATNEEIWQLAMQSLANVFKLNENELKGRLITWRVANWTADPFTHGSYAYDMVGSDEARKVLNQPVDGTLYFTGEYLYDGPAMGTVEAALDSGLKVAGNIPS
jgi:monoamine oxidase